LVGQLALGNIGGCRRDVLDHATGEPRREADQREAAVVVVPAGGYGGTM